MALSDSDRAKVEVWTGPVLDADEASVEARITRLGYAEVAALEILMIRRGELRSNATKIGTGRKQVDHTANLRALDDAIAELVAAILDDDDLSLSDAAEDLVARASGQTLGATSEIDVLARHRRRG